MLLYKSFVKYRSILGNTMYSKVFKNVVKDFDSFRTEYKICELCKKIVNDFYVFQTVHILVRNVAYY